MTRAILEACRHRIANDDMSLGREPSAVLAEIDAVLAEPDGWRDDAKFLIDRLNEWSADHLTEDSASDWHGHVGPAMARFRATIDAAPISPKAAEGEHTPGEWREGIAYGSIVADHPVPGFNGSDHVEAYGGHMVAESVAPQNRPIIKAAPTMLAALEPFARTADDYGDDDPDDTKVDDLGVCEITLGHCRAARAAYRKAKGGGDERR